MKKIVVIGGGTGQSIMLRAVKNIENIDLKTIVTVADDGGSTGRIREIFDLPAVGDIRNLMIALSEDENLLADLMAYRFDSGSKEFSGHNLGNLILVALINNSDSFLEAINQMSHFLAVKGEIIPSTGFKVTLCAKMQNGDVVTGEHNITEHNGVIDYVYYKDKVYANPKALNAIVDADYIIFSIGSLYTSILPNVIIDDIKLSLMMSKAKKIYFCNAMSEKGETTNYSVQDHVRVLEKHLRSPIDVVVMAKDEVPSQVIDNYQDSGSFKVVADESEINYELVEADLLTFEKNIVRHDVDKVREVLERIIE